MQQIAGDQFTPSWLLVLRGIANMHQFRSLWLFKLESLGRDFFVHNDFRH